MIDLSRVELSFVPFLVGIAACLALAVGAVPASASSPNRVYEQVSPVDKSGGDVIPDVTRGRAGSDGNRFMWASLTGFGDTQGIGVSTDYFSARDGAGVWRTHGIGVPQDSTGYFGVLAAVEPTYAVAAADLSWGVLTGRTRLPVNSPNVAGAVNLYRRSDLAQAGAGTYTLLTDASSAQTSREGAWHRPDGVVASADGSKVMFESRRSLTDETPPCLSAPEDFACPPYVYKATAGVPQLVGVLPPSEGGGPAAASRTGASAQRRMSQDGSRVVFTVPVTISERIGDLYLHDDQGTATAGDDTSQRINASERAAPDPGGPQPAEFWDASDDLSLTYFTTDEQLTDDDINGTSDLYRFDAGASPGARLTRVSVDSEPADGLEPAVEGAIAASADGSYVYFITTGSQLVAGGPIGPTGGPYGGRRIFVWHDGGGTPVIREVGAVNVGDEVRELLGRGGEALPTARVSSSGTQLAFVTAGTAELLSLYGHAEYDHGSTCAGTACKELYVYDATANGGSGDLRCASCNPTGAAATAHAGFTGFQDGSAARRTEYQNHPLTENGLVFFDTAERLQTSDTNDVSDVYEYDIAARRVRLVSGGKGSQPSTFMDATPDGRDVFFTTYDRLRSSDTDQSRDVYDARIGGVPDPGSEAPGVCDGEGCRSAMAPKLALPALPSGVTDGPSDPVARRGLAAFFSIQRLGKGQRRALVRTGRGSVVVRVSRPGTVRLALRARIGRHAVTIQRVRRTLRAGATVRLRLLLNDAARRELANSGRLRLAITTSHSRTARSRTLRLLLRR